MASWARSPLDTDNCSDNKVAAGIATHAAHAAHALGARGATFSCLQRDCAVARSRLCALPGRVGGAGVGVSAVAGRGGEGTAADSSGDVEGANTTVEVSGADSPSSSASVAASSDSLRGVLVGWVSAVSGSGNLILGPLEDYRRRQSEAVDVKPDGNDVLTAAEQEEVDGWEQNLSKPEEAEQLEDSLAALDVTLDDEVLRQCDAVHKQILYPMG